MFILILSSFMAWSAPDCAQASLSQRFRSQFNSFTKIIDRVISPDAAAFYLNEIITGDTDEFEKSFSVIDSSHSGRRPVVATYLNDDAAKNEIIFTLKTNHPISQEVARQLGVDPIKSIDSLRDLLILSIQQRLLTAQNIQKINESNLEEGKRAAQLKVIESWDKQSSELNLALQNASTVPLTAEQIKYHILAALRIKVSMDSLKLLKNTPHENNFVMAYDIAKYITGWKKNQTHLIGDLAGDPINNARSFIYFFDAMLNLFPEFLLLPKTQFPDIEAPEQSSLSDENGKPFYDDVQ
jgi:hypothetical protein